MAKKHSKTVIHNGASTLHKVGAGYSVNGYSRLQKQFWNPYGELHQKDHSEIYPLSKRAAKPDDDLKTSANKVKTFTHCEMCGRKVRVSNLLSHKRAEHPEAIGLANHKARSKEGVMTSMAEQLLNIGLIDTDKAQKATQKFDADIKNKFKRNASEKKKSRPNKQLVTCGLCGVSVKKTKLISHIDKVHHGNVSQGRKETKKKTKNKTRRTTGVVPGRNRPDPLLQEVSIKKAGGTLNGGRVQNQNKPLDTYKNGFQKCTLSVEEATQQRRALAELSVRDDKEIQKTIENSPYHDDPYGPQGVPQDTNRWDGHGSVSVGHKKK